MEQNNFNYIKPEVTIMALNGKICSQTQHKNQSKTLDLEKILTKHITDKRLAS